MIAAPPTTAPLTARSSLADWHAAHRGILFRVSRAYGRGPRDAAELEQEMLFQLWSALPRFAQQSKPSTWVYRICLNTALTWRRGVGRRERHFENEVELAVLPGEGPTPAAATEQRERLDKLYDALRQLNPAERALVLLMLDGLSHREIGEIAGLTENHVAVSLLRIRRRLATLMKGVSDELG
jgi:RNA polymerase sigma-70 factor (ECF subfamily)